MEVRGIQLVGRWTKDELAEIKQILAPLPAAYVEKNVHFHAIERQPVLADAPPEAPGHSKYDPSSGTIVVYDKGVYHGSRIDPEQFRRSVYHELAHAIVRGNPDLLERWSASTRSDGFVDDYAKTSPEEDWADTFSEVLIHGDRVRRVVPLKFAFVRRELAHASFQ